MLFLQVIYDLVSGAICVHEISITQQSSKNCQRVSISNFSGFTLYTARYGMLPMTYYAENVANSGYAHTILICDGIPGLSLVASVMNEFLLLCFWQFISSSGVVQLTNLAPFNFVAKDAQHTHTHARTHARTHTHKDTDRQNKKIRVAHYSSKI